MTVRGTIRGLAMAAWLAALVGCGTQATPQAADLVSPQALALSGNEIYVASTDSDELRVLELDAGHGVAGFAPAPNPIYVLSIPVVPQPFALVADTDGSGTAGAYLFALSAVAGRVGVVLASTKQEVTEVSLPGTPLSLAARTDPDGSGGATVYVGLALDSGQGAVATLHVPSPAQLQTATLGVQVSFPLGEAAPASLALSPDGTTLAIGDRSAPSAPGSPTRAGGGVILLSLGADGGALTRVDVGGPVGRLAYSPAAQAHAEAGSGLDGGPSCVGPGGTEITPQPDSTEAIPAGRYLYALIDGSGCALGHRCGGVRVLRDGALLESSPGVPAEPAPIPGAGTDLAVAASTPQANVVLGGTCQRPPLVVAVPSTNGYVYFVNGIDGQLFDAQPAAAQVGDITYSNPDGGAGRAPEGSGPSNVVVQEGGLDSQDVVVAYQGLLPVLGGRQAVVSAASGGASELQDVGVDFAGLGVEVGDSVELSGGCDGGDVAAPVTAVAPGALGLGGAVDPACFPPGGTATYRVRVATPADPYLVAGSIAGYLGRTHAGGSFASTVPYYWRVASSTDGGAAADGGPPALSFDMGSVDLSDPGAAWQFSVASGVSPVASGGGVNAILPGPVVWVPQAGAFFVGYPGSQLGSQLSEIFPAGVSPGTSSGVIEFD